MLKYIPIKSLLGWLFSALFFICYGEVKAQTPTYLNGTKTGNRFQAGSLIGLGTGSAGLSAPLLSYGEGCVLNIITTTPFRFYYGDGNILNGSTSNFTTVTASRDFGLLGLLGSGADAYLQFRNTSNVAIPAGTPTYFKLNQRPSNTGITVPVGGLLGIVELQNIKGEGYIGATDYKKHTGSWSSGIGICNISYNGNENNGLIAGSSTTELLIDKTGNWFAKVTPSAAYNAVRLNVAFPADLTIASVAAEIKVNVYNAFTQTDGGDCNLSPQYTSPGEVLGGITLTTAAVTAGLGINLNQLVTNPQQAINGNVNDYSSFSSGVANVGVANTIAQSLYFDHSSTVESGIRVQLGIQQSLINLGVLGRSAIKFKAYKGTSTTPVYSTDLASLTTLLNLNLLNLVTINGSTHKKLDLTFKPGVVFDRLEISFDQGLVAVGVLGDALRIYEVSMAPSLPTITLQPTNTNSSNICEGSSANFSVTATASAGGVVSGYQWQYFNTLDSTWANVSSGTTSTLSVTSVTNAMNNRWYRAKITGGNASCPQDIYSNEVQLTVRPKAQASDIDAPNISVCKGLQATLAATCTNVTILSPTFKWYDNATLTGPPLATTSSLNVTPIATTSYWVTVEGTATCQNAPNSAKQVTVTVIPHPPPAITVN